MSISLEKLYKQREQIKRHLEWLDEIIADLEINRAAPEKKENDLSSEELLDSPVELDVRLNPTSTEFNSISKQAEFGPERQEKDESLQPAILKNEKTPEETGLENQHLLEPDPEAPIFKAKRQSELRTAQVGCLILFFSVTALFLFLLFGLPYLL